MPAPSIGELVPFTRHGMTPFTATNAHQPCHSAPPEPRSGAGRSRNPLLEPHARSVVGGSRAVYAARDDTVHSNECAFAVSFRAAGAAQRRRTVAESPAGTPCPLRR